MKGVIPSVATTGTFTSAQVAIRADVSYRSLMRWAEQGLLDPARADTGKAKSPLVWTAKHLREATVLGQLRAHKLPLQTIRKVMDYLRSIGHNPLSTGEFICIGKPSRSGTVVKVCTDGEVLDLIKRGQLVLPLEPIRED
jgi:DNA-binding transcriptional MerR regulator